MFKRKILEIKLGKEKGFFTHLLFRCKSIFKVLYQIFFNPSPLTREKMLLKK